MNTRPTKAPSGFRPVPKTGVIFVMSEASARGYRRGSPEWANFGQGAPETGPLPGAPERLRSISFSDDETEYAPVAGLHALKQAVADLYNARYRQGKESQYGPDNVAIAAGGRLSVTRAVSTLGRTNVGHLLPDYTAYEELLDTFGTFSPIPILLDPKSDYAFTPEALLEEILGRGLSALLLSNPCNPTGKHIHGPELAEWVRIARETHTTLIFDEFYSHYAYEAERLTVSAAEYVEDVEQDGILLIDGLTKNWRYPGFRVAWTVGPKAIIEGISSAGSFIDGGCAQPMQLAALKLVNQEVADAEAEAIHRHFKIKRDILMNGLEKLGIDVRPKPAGSFYCWGDISGLPEGLGRGMQFFERALEKKVITVPGSFFDINPGRRRAERPSRFANYVRFSFGPSREEIERGLAGLAKL